MALALAEPAAGIKNPLDRLRGLIRRYVVLDGLLTAGFVGVAGAGLSIVADVGLFELADVDLVVDAPGAVRAVLLAAVTMAVLAVVGASIVYRMTREFADPALALVLEKRFPDLLGDRLITAVEMADEAKAERSGYSLAMVRRTVAEADARLASLPVATVFDWRHLRARALGLAGLAVALVAASYPVAGGLAGSFDSDRVLDRAADTASIWARRDVLLQDVAWPRRSYLTVVEPAAAEVRIAKDAPAPKIRVTAAEWVIADRTTRYGWRPVAWADLAGLNLAAPDAVAGKTAVGRTVDEVVAEAGPDESALAAILAGLTELAGTNRQTAAVRHLDPPTAVVLRYSGFIIGPSGAPTPGSTRGEVTLTRDPAGGFAAELAGLKESVTYTVRAADFCTDTRAVVLVPPPQLTRLVRAELQPAYLFHPAPADAALQTLAGLRQVMPDKDLSLTGEKSVAAVPRGTELVLSGMADKPLAAVAVAVKTGRVPLTCEVNGDSFSLAFRGPDALTADAAFDLVLTDADGVTSRRAVLFQVVDDQPPQVEVAVEGLRKAPGGYLCTAKAGVPFVKEAFVRDDTGLATVVFAFTATRQESAAVAGLQAQAVMTAFAAAPVVGGFGTAAGPVAAGILTRRLTPDNLTQSVTLPVPAFERLTQAIPRPTAAGLAAALSQPWPGTGAGVVKDVKLGGDDGGFDLQDADAALAKAGRAMRVTDAGEIQPRYAVMVNVVATDVNVLTGPKQGRNLEPVRLTVVSEADLLAEITKDEESIAARFDEALKRLREAQVKLTQQAEKLASTNLPPDLLLAARVRAEDITQDMAKGRDLVQNVAGEYARLVREVRINRCEAAVVRRFKTGILAPIEAVLATEYRAADEAMSAYREPLVDGKKPADPQTTAARETLAILITRLEQIRRDLGDSLSEGKLRDDLRRLIERQREVSAAIATLVKGNRDRLFAPELLAVEPITVAPGKAIEIKQGIDWKLFDKGELRVRFTAPAGNGVVAPAEVIVKDDVTEFSYTVVAGPNPGVYVLTVVPSVGPSVGVTITVK